jgi:hypothetical protein
LEEAMQKILSSNVRVYAVLFVLAGMFAYAAQPVKAAAAASKGCWYEVGNPPACDICGWDCASGQVCCGITVEQPE